MKMAMRLFAIRRPYLRGRADLLGCEASVVSCTLPNIPFAGLAMRPEELICMHFPDEFVADPFSCGRRATESLEAGSFRVRLFVLESGDYEDSMTSAIPMAQHHVRSWEGVRGRSHPPAVTDEAPQPAGISVLRSRLRTLRIDRE